MASSKDDMQKKVARDSIKEERARDAALAIKEYESEQLAVAAKTLRLRALRLARDASTPPPVAKSTLARSTLAKKEIVKQKVAKPPTAKLPGTKVPPTKPPAIKSKIAETAQKKGN